MHDEEEVDFEAETLLAPMRNIGKNLKYKQLATLTEIKNPCHAPLVWCLTEVHPLADLYLQKVINDPKRPWGTFMYKLYKQLYQTGARNQWTSVDMSKLLEQAKKNKANYFKHTPQMILYKIERDILDRHQIKRTELEAADLELFAFELRQISECVNGHKVDKPECYKYGFDINHSG